MSAWKILNTTFVGKTGEFERVATEWVSGNDWPTSLQLSPMTYLLFPFFFIPRLPAWLQGEKTNHQALTASCLLFVFEIVHSTQQRCYLCFGTSKRITRWCLRKVHATFMSKSFCHTLWENPLVSIWGRFYCNTSSLVYWYTVYLVVFEVFFVGFHERLLCQNSAWRFGEYGELVRYQPQI